MGCAFGKNESSATAGAIVIYNRDGKAVAKLDSKMNSSSE